MIETTGHLDAAVMLLDYLSGNRKAEAGAAILGCIERLEYPFNVGFVNAAAGVDERNNCVISLAGGGDGELAAVDQVYLDSWESHF